VPRRQRNPYKKLIACVPQTGRDRRDKIGSGM